MLSRTVLIRRTLAIVLLGCVGAFAQGIGGKAGAGGKAGFGGGASVAATLVQHPTNFTCASASCSVTTTSSGAGHLLVLFSDDKYANGGVSVPP
jgi:hypothetical protein